MADDNIKVCARFRPLNKMEQGKKEVITDTGSGGVEIRPVDAGTQGALHKFQFDNIFGSDCKQEDVYKVVGQPVVADIFKGYNGTIFVYGQTGSGKSHTMMGPSAATAGFCDDPEQMGIIPRVVREIFVNVEDSDPQIEFSIKVSYVEIYMEKIRDLLEPSKVNLQLREDFKGGKGVYIADATEEYVADPEEIFDLMRAGAANRVVSSTAMNDTSSRSHAIFSIAITSKHSVKLEQKTGKLYLVDLAGSEKVGKTRAEGQQLEEAKLINKSLSALGLVINALTDRKAGHVPYRDSKLTRLLQDSLGGNSRTSLVVCGSMSEFNQWETLSTLRFGQRAKSIKNKAKINRELSVAEYKILLAQLEKEIKTLRAEKGMPQEGSLGALGDVDAADTAKLKAELMEERENMAQEKADLLDELQGYKENDTVKTQLIEHYRSDFQHFQEEADAWEAEYKDLLAKTDELQVLLDQDRRAASEKMAVIGSCYQVASDMGKEALSVKVTLQSMKSHAEQQSLAQGGALDEDQEKEVIAWRRERAASRQEEVEFRKGLLSKIDTFVEVDKQLVTINNDYQKDLEAEVSGLKANGLHAVGKVEPEGEYPETESAMRLEIDRLRAMVRDLEKGDVVAASALEAVKAKYLAEMAEKDQQLARLNNDMERHVSETKELRNSLLKDLQSRCEKVIDLEMAIDESREQFKQLMVASSNKALRKRVQLLESQHNQQSGNIAEILNESSTLRLEYKLAEKKLSIRNERIENLKTGLKEEKRHMKELKDNASAERTKLKQECARFKEEMNFWRDKCLKAASATANNSATGKAGRIIKVLKGGHHKADAPLRDDA